jgi:hypothetical protein
MQERRRGRPVHLQQGFNLFIIRLNFFGMAILFGMASLPFYLLKYWVELFIT